jgi:hypothetical protein
MRFDSKVIRKYIFCLAFCFIAFPIAAHAQGGRFSNASFEGNLTADTGPSICMQGGFALRDCQGQIIIRLSETEGGLDLDSLLGQYVMVKGEDVGVECPIIAPSRVTVKANSCITPQQPTGNFHEGILQRNDAGEFELRNCLNNVILKLTASQNIGDLEPFIGKFVRVKGRMLGKQAGGDQRTIRIRTIIVKPNPCIVA